MNCKRVVPALMLATALTLRLAGAAGAALYAYIPDSSDDRVWRFDLANNEAIPITVGFAPIAVDGSSDGSVVVVASVETYPNAGTASVIDGATATVRWTVPVGVNPRGIGVTPDGSKAYVSSYQDYTVTVIDTVSGTVVKTITLDGSLGGVAMSPSGHRAYVVQNSFAGTVASIDTTTDEVTAVILASQVDPAQSVTADPTGTFLFVGHYNSVSIIDAATNLLLDNVEIDCSQGCSGVESLASSADGNRLYFGQNYGAGAHVLDVATRTIEPLPSSLGDPASVVGMDVTPDGGALYVVSRYGIMDVIDTATETLRSTIPTIAHDPLAFGEFIVGPTVPTPTPTPPTPTPTPPGPTPTPAPTATPAPTPAPPPTPTPTPVPTPPFLGDSARGCQKAVLDSFKTFGAKAHQYLSGCLLKLQKDHAVGVVTSATTSACVKDLAPGATSRLGKARALARQRILTGCAASTAQALGGACDPGASSIAELADCALDRQLAGVTEILQGEIAGACGLLAEVALDGSFPSLCP